MEIKKIAEGNEITLKVEGWLDTQASPQLREEINSLDASATKLILDFSKLEFISSSGVREVVAAYKKMHGALVVRNVSSGLMSIFKATGIDNKIKFE